MQIKLPGGIDAEREDQVIWLDECIIPVMLALWANHKQTRGCCCGHGKENPSIVIAKAYVVADVLAIRDIIKSVDGREWDIYQWQLVKVHP